MICVRNPHSLGIIANEQISGYNVLMFDEEKIKPNP